VAAIASVLMIASAHAQEGARAYFLLPTGTNDAELTTTLLDTENAAGVFDSSTVTPSYRHTFDIQGDASTFLIGLPLGALSATLNTLGGPLDLNANLAQGDLFVGGTLGLIGAPALAPMAYAQFKPGLAVDLTTRVFLPTGDYHSSRLLNLGQNRWSLETLLPISYVLGGSLLDPKLTTFEIIPSVQVFGDNKDTFGPAALSSEAPLFGLEGHITHNFSQAIWASVDGYGEFGGETSSDGVANRDSQQTVSLGATLGLTLSRSVALRLNYLQQVYSKAPDTSSREFMATAAFLF
jgi:hypothetical protein